MNRQTKVGLLVLAAILTVYLAISWIKQSGIFESGRTTYYILFPNVNGLKTSDPVTMFGYPVGNVRALKPMRDGVRVEIGLEPDVQLYADASAAILIKEILSGKQIEITPGRSTRILQAGATIAGNATFDFTVAIEKMGQIFNKMEPARVESLIVNIERLTNGMANLAQNLKPETLNATLSETRATLAQFRALLEKAENERLLVKTGNLLDTIGRLSLQTRQTISSINQNIDTLAPITATTLRNVNKTLYRIDSLTFSLDQMIRALENNGGTASALIYDPHLKSRLDTLLTTIDIALRAIYRGDVNVAVRLSNPKDRRNLLKR